MKKIVIFNKTNKKWFKAGDGSSSFWTEDAAYATTFSSRNEAARWVRVFAGYLRFSNGVLEIKEIDG